MLRLAILLLLSLVFVSAALLVQQPDEQAELLKQSEELQSRIDHAIKELENGATDLLEELSQNGGDQWMRANAVGLERLRKSEGTIYLGLRADSIYVWTGSPPIRPSSLVRNTEVLVRSGDAIYLHSSATRGGIELHALRPIWLAPPLENRYIEGGFHPSWNMPKGAAVAMSGQFGAQIDVADTGVAFGLIWRDGALENGEWIWLRTLLIAIGVSLLIAAFWMIGSMLAGRSPILAGILFSALVVGLRWWWLSAPAIAPFDRLSLFDPALYATSFAFPSLGDLLINSILLFVICAFVRDRMIREPWRMGAFACLFAWIVVLAYGHWITDLMIGVVQDGSVDLDLYHIQGLDRSSGIALFSMAFLFASWCVLAVSFIGSMAAADERQRNIRIGMLIVIGAIMLEVIYQIDGLMSWSWQIPILAMVVLARDERRHFALMVIGVLVISAFTAAMLTRYTAEKERQERQVLAERLATREDPVIELLFLEMAPRLRSDRQVYEMLSGGRACSTTDLDLLVRQRFFGGYWERYDIRLFAFGTRGNVLCATDPEPPRSFRGEQSVFTDPRAAADMPDLLMEELAGLGTFYHSRVSVMPVDTLPPAQLIVELYPRTISQGLGFPDLLIAGDDPISRRAIRYTHARYERGHLAEQAGAFAYPLKWSRTLDSTGHLWYTEDGSDHFVTSTPQGSLFVLGSPKPSLLDKATTFSYLFTLFSVLAAIAAMVRSMIKERGIPAIGIGLKVRIVLVIFSITSLVLFGVGTRRLLDAQYDQRSANMIMDKARSVHMELQHRLDGEPVLTRDDAPYLDHVLGQASNVFFTDITLYGLNGRMLSTSRPQIFTSGLLGRRMDPVAYTQLVLNEKSSFIHEEAIGNARFRAAYMPLRDRDGQVLAYLSLPAFADQRQQEEERSSVLIAVVNLFVLLFALSVIVAIFISNWTLRPLDLLKRALSIVDLRGADQPIRYRGNDEVGQLVHVYNQKVEELKRSAEKLAVSERESAWREMARQVAHEIKNPLTPMKLGIQQFQRSWHPNAPDASEKLDRFSRAMVGQIDALNGVATAFSQFAQMPVAMPQKIDLNEVVRSTVDVFKATPNVRISIIEHPGLVVSADREHLVRAFNNLLKNAVQSIPDDRMGEVQVSIGKNNGNALVEVRDNGSGIPDGVRERIFTPSFTTKSSGMGLGLAMVKRIVEGSGGTVRFETTEGEGTRFFISLPLAR